MSSEQDYLTEEGEKQGIKCLYCEHRYVQVVKEADAQITYKCMRCEKKFMELR